MSQAASITLSEARFRPVAHPRACADFLGRLRGRPGFACVIGSTATAEIPDISAAGETPEKRRYTAALDSEYLVTGHPLTLPEIPRNPLGPPSPVVVTRAALGLLGVEPWIIDAGTRVPPRVPRLVVAGRPGRCITTGNALDLGPEVTRDARHVGRLLANSAPWVIVAECVPGGTTTAMALLEALGVPAAGRVSSSIPGGNHGLKREVVRRALEAAALPRPANGLAAAAAVGDPMQPVAAVMALEASLRVPVVLGGGTQMAAVAALALRLLAEGFDGDPRNLALATTRWVAEDRSADLGGIMEELPRPLATFSAQLDFGSSSLPALRRYEEGLVKEGVGAGAAAFAAFLAGRSAPAELLLDIEGLVRALPGR